MYWFLTQLCDASRDPNQGTRVIFKFKHRSSSLFSRPPLFTAARRLPHDFPQGPSMGGDDICACHVMSPPFHQPRFVKCKHAKPPHRTQVCHPQLRSLRVQRARYVIDHCSPHDTIYSYSWSCHPPLPPWSSRWGLKTTSLHVIKPFSTPPHCHPSPRWWTWALR